MSFLGFGKKRAPGVTTLDGTVAPINEVATYGNGKYYNPATTTLGGSYEDLYNSEAEAFDKKTGKSLGKVKTDQSFMNLTAEQQAAINNNKNLKETQDRLKKQGANAQQSVLGGRGY